MVSWPTKGTCVRNSQSGHGIMQSYCRLKARIGEAYTVKHTQGQP